jgi:hypothetical protein
LSTLRRYGLRAAGAVALALVGCNQLLGIEESFVDPALEPAPEGGGEGGERSEASTGGSPAEPSSGGSDIGGERASGGTAGAAGAPGEPDLCEEYCALMRDHCVGDAAQYRDDAQCLTICRTFPEGTLDDDRVNTVSCRRRYASKARYLAGPELAADCSNAGPGGNGRCGSYCEGLCTVTMAACNRDVSDPYFYASLEDCLADCGPLPSSRYQYGTEASGNSLECRLFHASSALMADADEHCEHSLGITLCTD